MLSVSGNVRSEWCRLQFELVTPPTLVYTESIELYFTSGCIEMTWDHSLPAMGAKNKAVLCSEITGYSKLF